MNLLIHDLSEKEFESISAKYEGWEIISDKGNIKPCVGCFGCWIKNPGECVIKDGYHQMGSLIHQADEVVVISRYTYGGFSSFIKNVFDKSISWVLPYFEVYEGEMHHKKRYPEDKKMRFIFRGNDLTDEDRKKAEQYVNAVCRNLHGKVLGVEFQEMDVLSDKAAIDENENLKAVQIQESDPEKVILLNCRLRGDKANTKHILNKVGEKLTGIVEDINLSKYISKTDELISMLSSAEKIVFGTPLYVDGIPSAPLLLMEKIERINKITPLGKKKIYAVVNMGLYESVQMNNLLSMVKTWCEITGFTYGGALAVGAGEMIGPMLSGKDISKGPTKMVAQGINKLSEAINSSDMIDDVYTEPYKFPRAFYMGIANMGWPMDAKKNGLKKKDILKQK